MGGPPALLIDVSLKKTSDPVPLVCRDNKVTRHGIRELIARRLFGHPGLVPCIGGSVGCLDCLGICC